MCALLLSACGNAPPQELKDLAVKEKDWLTQLQPITEQIKSDYNQWDTGKITREQLAEKLSKYIPKVLEMRKQYEQYRNEVKLSEEVRNNPDFDNGLYNGYSLRLNVITFLYQATIGYPSAPSDTGKDMQPKSDDFLRELYRTELVEGYERKLNLLQVAIDKLID